MRRVRIRLPGAKRRRGPRGRRSRRPRLLRRDRTRPDWKPERVRFVPRRVATLEIDTPTRRLDHDLHPLLAKWRHWARRRQLQADPSFVEHQAQVRSVLAGVAWDVRQANRAPHRPDRLRAIAWNVERGKRFEPLRGALLEDARLADVDLLLLTEVDVGMDRSGNRDVPRELAEALGMGYVFANFHLVLAPGDRGEQDVEGANTHAMHGCALLSRVPIRRVASVPLPEFRDKFRALEKRLGCKRALLCELELPDGPLTVVVVHLDPFAPPRHRVRQMRKILGALRRFGGSKRVLLGGDLNTTTYHMGGAAGLAFDLARKLVRFGFAGTIANYMTPDRVYERRLIAHLSKAGFSSSGFVDPEVPTIYYDINDPEIVDKSLDVAGRRVVGWLQRRLEPWGGAVPMRLDWFFGRALSPVRAWTVERPRHRGERIADHNPVGVEIALSNREHESS